LEWWGNETRVLVSYSPDRWFFRPEVNKDGDLVLREVAFLNTTLGQFIRLAQSGCCWAVNQLEIGDAREFSPLPLFAQEYLWYDSATIWINQNRKVTPWHMDAYHGIFSPLMGKKDVTLVQDTPKHREALRPLRIPIEQLVLTESAEQLCLSSNFTSQDHPAHNYTRERCPCLRKNLDALGSFATANAFRPCMDTTHEDDSIFGGEKTLCNDKSFLEHLPKIRCVLSPGDILFVPAGWWHQVESFVNDSSLSAMISQWFFRSQAIAQEMNVERNKQGSFLHPQRDSKKNAYSVYNFDFLSSRM